MLCGRASGQVRDGAFRRLPSAPPLKTRAGRSRCGYCGGSLYLEAEDSPFSRELGAYARNAASLRPVGRTSSRASASRAS
ncbi:MAG: hypothetical protein U0893_02510 [Chloroflexota bacterium]